MYESMVFYRSFYEAVKDLTPEVQGRIYSAILAYGLDGIDPDLNGIEKSIFTLIKPQIDANNRRKENGKKGAKYGEKGGRPKKENPTETPKKPLKNPTETPNVNVKVNANVNENVNESDTAPGKLAYGYYNNVRLTKDEFQSLIDNYPDDYPAMIDNLSMYLRSKGRYYADHYATMMKWKREDAQKEKNSPNTKSPEHGSAEDLSNFYDMVDIWTQKEDTT